MSLYKQLKDHAIKFVLGDASIPPGLAELRQYFKAHGPIRFRVERSEEGYFIAVSEGFHNGGIVTSADTLTELEEEIEDAILTSFSIPSSYAKEANIHRVGKSGYAFA